MMITIIRVFLRTKHPNQVGIFQLFTRKNNGGIRHLNSVTSYCRYHQTRQGQKKNQDSMHLNSFELLTKEDMKQFFPDIKKELNTEASLLHKMCHYYFDAAGKSVRPKIVFLVASACNNHLKKDSQHTVSHQQRKVAIIAEMLHTGSLIHDDVVDVSKLRRGKDSVNHVWGDRNAVLAGNYVLSRASHLVASIRETEVVTLFARIIDDLVRGEFMQLDGSTSFDHYLKKTYKKTASLIANTCQAVAFLSQCPDNITRAMHEYGRNVGIAFQLIDDLLDFSQSGDSLGKPAAADLRLGIVTAPVLFASEKHPFLHDMILSRFKNPGDVEKAIDAVKNSDGIQGTFLLAKQYCEDAKRSLNCLHPSPEKQALFEIADAILVRTK